MNKRGIAISSLIYSILILFLSLTAATLAILASRKVTLDKMKQTVSSKLNNEAVEENYYIDNSGAAYPELYDNMVAVTLTNDGVYKASLYDKWYDYNNLEWANAVILKSEDSYADGEKISESDIEGYFVWIPRFRYRIFDLGNYTSVTNYEDKKQKISVIFETKNKLTNNGNEVGKFLTHPAFISLDVNGFWVAKFEASEENGVITSLPNKYAISTNIKNGFIRSYNYKRENDSHLMKNTEWGAMAYLSHSRYGINKEIRINNTTLTGCGADTNNASVSNTCSIIYSKSNEYPQSTTGNITGVFDTSGGLWEHVAAFKEGSPNLGFTQDEIASYDSKYFDKYPSNSDTLTYLNRILGDATGELGPFYNHGEIVSSWYNDLAWFVNNDRPWFIRGGGSHRNATAGIFAFANENLEHNNGFRVVLSGK